MKFILTVALVLTSLLFSCEKEENSQPDCERLSYGSLCFRNSISDPVDVFVDDRFQFRLSTGQSSCVTILSAGVHEYYAEQASGYILFPDTWEGTSDVISCNERTINLIR